MLSEWQKRWNLTPDGAPLLTHSSHLQPVRTETGPAMLKVALSEEELRGHHLMVWWAGDGAARVFRHEGPALLMERLDDDQPLGQLASSGMDDEATRLLCRAAARLHAPRLQPWPELPDLSRWFQGLAMAAPGGGLFAQCWDVAQDLLQFAQAPCPLHGDLHHGNVLHSAARGWLAIDPKGLIGERSFDFANLLCNPSLDVARRPGRLARQATVIATEAGLDRTQLLRWVTAYAGLSAAWHLEDGQSPQAAATLDVARLALAEVGGG
ncbi:aminoglycoside phosphotransferase family protein [Deinococcus navajonensis]|uniref:Aminoglycoside phosphotransferase family protein n=1 Tax=Deinococcus navajonensis TaxID=309884 RepID=A0ABV8XJD2_9DEIO